MAKRLRYTKRYREKKATTQVSDMVYQSIHVSGVKVAPRAHLHSSFNVKVHTGEMFIFKKSNIIRNYF